MNLTIAFSTRKLDETYIKHIKETCGIRNVEVLSYENPNGESLTKIYTKFLELYFSRT